MKTLLTATALAAAVLLAACGKESAPATTTQAAAPGAPGAPGASAPAPSADTGKEVSIDTIQAQTQGFAVGSPMSARVVYVFFDAQCPHCAALWYAAKPLKSQTKLVWIPVRLLNDTSEVQGAAMLASKDPAQAMDDHEASMADHKGGIKAEGDVAAQRAAVKKNTELFNKYAFASVPTLVTKSAQTGAVVTHEGSLATADLAAFVGVPAPSR